MSASDLGAVVVAVAQLGRPGTDAHPHLQRLGELTVLRAEHELRRDRRADRIVRIGEHRVGAVGGGLHHAAAVTLDRLAHDLVPDQW